jgi:hypothetical protein
MINHITTNLVTKGLLNISNITKGMIEIKYEIVFRKRGGAQKAPGIPLHYDEESLFDEIIRHEEEDVECIKVYVDWKNLSKKGIKKIKAELLKTFIEAEILEKTTKHITVQIFNQDNKKI